MGPKGEKRKRILSEKRESEVFLIAITVVWGLTFSLVKESLVELQPFVFMSYRFWLAFIVTGLFCFKKLRKIDRDMLKAGLLLGVLLYGSYAFQTFGLKYTSAGNAGFITGLFIVFVPVLSVLFLKHRPDLKSIIAVVVALVGLGFLSIQPNFHVNSGDFLVLACALSYSIHIILLDGYVKRYDLMLLTFLQMGFLALGNTASGLIFESFVLPRSWIVWLSIIICGVFASAVAFYVQGYAQRVLTPVRTSMVLIMEPVFSVLFGIILLGERLSWRGWLGCGIILTGMLLTEIPTDFIRRRGKEKGA
ncbi:MAG: DMT family transporter [Actinobacteria bacterium]|nr:DMT family transporter [Actinomycetota bacterium]